MGAFDGMLERKLAMLGLPLAVVLPGGRRVGADDALVTLRLIGLGAVAHIAAGDIGKVAQDHVEGRLDFDGSLRDLMAMAARIVDADPTRPSHPAPLAWWRDLIRGVRSRTRHDPRTDARQVRFHYDLHGPEGDAFYALWLDPLCVYSCAYWREPGLDLAGAQRAKLDHVCRKLMLREGERFLDIGAGWGGLLLWAAEHYGVRAHGITLSRNQHAHVQRLIDERRLAGRVSVALTDYRDLPEQAPWDKIASIGMFEHVGHARLPAYFAKIRRLLRPGGLLMNHGITAAGTRNTQLGAGMGDFIERYIFPGGELLHVSHVLRVMSEAGLEPLDIESLRPHYARTLWAWSDALEAQLGAARRHVPEAVIRAYRLYLAGCAMSFEQGWISLFQMLASRPSGEVADGPVRGAQSHYPFQRGYMYAEPPTIMIYKFKSKAAGDLIMMQPTGDHVLRILGKEPAPQGIVEPAAMPAAMAAIEQAIVAEEAAREQAEREAAAEGHKLPPREAVSLRQRAWPLVEMMKRAHAADEPIVWGV